MKLYDRVFPPRIMELENGKTIAEPRSRMPAVILVLLLMGAVSVQVTGFSLSTLLRRGNEFFVILGQMFPPNTNYFKHVWSPLFDTIKMSLLGSAIGSLFVIPFSVVASTNIVKNRAVVSLVRVFLSIVRTLPTLVTALIATYVFGLGTLAGTTAIAVFTFAYMGKILYEDIETVDMGAYEAMEAIGASRPRAFIAAILPQVMPGYLSNALFCFEGNVRYAAILGYVGAGGLGILMNEKLGWREYDSVGAILLLLFATVFIIENISRYFRKKLT